MPKETKIGLVVVAIVALVFGAVVVRKLRRPASPDEVASTSAAAADAPDANSGAEGSSPAESAVVVEPADSFNMTSVASSPASSFSRTPTSESNDIPSAAEVGLHSESFDSAGVSSSWGSQSDEFLAESNSGPQLSTGPYSSRSGRGDSALAGSSASGPSLSPSLSGTGAGYAGSRSQTVGRDAGPSFEPPVFSPSSSVSSGGEEDTMPVFATREVSRSGGASTSSGRLPDFSSTGDTSRPDASRTVELFAQDQDRYWTVQPGESFWSIAQQKYGSVRYFRALARWNQTLVSEPERLRPGMVVETPSAHVLEQTYSELVPAKSQPATLTGHNRVAGLSSDQSGGVQMIGGERYYQVQPADTLFDIAKKTLGQGSRWKEIYELNRDKLANPHQLQPGVILRLPRTDDTDDVASNPSWIR